MLCCIGRRGFSNHYDGKEYGGYVVDGRVNELYAPKTLVSRSFVL